MPTRPLVSVPVHGQTDSSDLPDQSGLGANSGHPVGAASDQHGPAQVGAGLDFRLGGKQDLLGLLDVGHGVMVSNRCLDAPGRWPWHHDWDARRRGPGDRSFRQGRAVKVMAQDQAWLDRIGSLNQWRRGGERAPHKPLLLLYALGRLQRLGTASVAFTDAEPDLGRLLDEFGPPRKTSPGYPFHHLTTDGLWVVRTPAGPGSPGPNLKDLRAGAVGALDPDFAQALEKDPVLFAGVVRSLLDANFPPTLHEDILDAVGIEMEPAELPQIPKARRRDPAFRERVLLAYEYRCAFCGFDGQLLREAVAIDAAHIRWWAAAGPDEVANGLALCSLHHKLFDRGAVGIATDQTVAVSSHFISRSPSGVQLVLDLAGRAMLNPQAGNPVPHPKHVSWHTSEVFRSPARSVAA